MERNIPRLQLAAMVLNNPGDPALSDVLVIVEKSDIHLPPPPRPLKARIETEESGMWLIVGVPVRDLFAAGPLSETESELLRTDGKLLLGQLNVGVIAEVREMALVSS